MKVNRIFTAFSAMAVAIFLSTLTFAAFEKTSEYRDGQFSDVKSGAWYENEVKSACEIGLMNGKSDKLFSPDGTMTVAEGITVAARVNAIYNGKTISEAKGDKWYSVYVSYAKENKLIKDGFTESYDRNIRRYELAELFAAALPDTYYAQKNNISSIPDVDENEEYFADLLKLYHAGVVLGYR